MHKFERFTVTTGTSEIPFGKVVYEVEQHREGEIFASRVAFLPCGKGPHRQIASSFLTPWPYDEMDYELEDSDTN